MAVAGPDRLAEAVLAVLRAVPMLLVLDGLEVVQQSPAGEGFGWLLDGTLREVLAGVCQQPGGGLVLLTSRFPFADLEGFDGTTARMLEVPPFTPAEGATLLAAAGGGWLPEDQRRALVRAVDGHALATGVLAGLLAARPPAADLAGLRAALEAAARTDARVGKVLEFYTSRLAEPDRYLLAAVSLFARPVPAEAVLAVAAHEVFGSRLAGWTPAMVQAAVTGRRAGWPPGTRTGPSRPIPWSGTRSGAWSWTRPRRGRDVAGRAAGRAGEQPSRRAAGGRGHRAAAGRRPVAARPGHLHESFRRPWCCVETPARGPARAARCHRVRGHACPPRRLRRPARPQRSGRLSDQRRSVGGERG